MAKIDRGNSGQACTNSTPQSRSDLPCPTSGLGLHSSDAADGRRIRTGMRSEGNLSIEDD
jgi:hypothetical protein